MRYILSLLIAFIYAVSALNAQDVIVLRSGESLKAYGVNVGKKFITYKLLPDDKGRKRIGRSKVFSVKKEFGEMVLISDTTTSLPTIKGDGEVARAVDDSNSEIIAVYNRVKGGCTGKSAGSRKTGRAIAIMGVGESSVLSNEDVLVEIVPYKRKGMRAMQYKIFLYNKSDAALYVDLENSFRIFNDGTSRPYFSSQKVARTKKSERRVVAESKYNVAGRQKYMGRKSVTGGIKVSESRKSGVSVSGLSNAKRLAIPPKSRAALPPKLYLNDDEVDASYDYFFMKLDKKKYNLKAWESIVLGEDESPVKNRFMVRYSTDEKFGHYSTVEFSLYLRELIGLGFFTRMVNGKIIRNYNEHTVFGKAVLK